MPILKSEKSYYPLDFGRMVKARRLRFVTADGRELAPQGSTGMQVTETHVYYDRSARGQSWFYLDLRTGSAPQPDTCVFIPSDATALITADGLRFCTKLTEV